MASSTLNTIFRIDCNVLAIQLPDIVNGTILLSAWSAAASDIYMSSRFLFFLGRRKHAPSVFAHLFRYPRRARDEHLSLLRDTDEDGSDSEQSDAGSSSGRGYGSDHGTNHTSLLAPSITPSLTVDAQT